jgi:hypothetical protein
MLVDGDDTCQPEPSYLNSEDEEGKEAEVFTFGGEDSCFRLFFSFKQYVSWSGTASDRGRISDIMAAFQGNQGS